MKRFAVIMAGGSGTRFWPKSCRKKPKQLLALTGKRSLLQMTSDRLTKLVPKKQIYVVATELLKPAIKKQIPGITILAEPEGRNTMAAVCWSAWEIAKKNPESSIAILPADASIEDVAAYRSALLCAFKTAEDHDRIVCLGIKPTFAATGYGYIEAGESIGAGAEASVHAITRFVEKPNRSKAEELFSSGKYLWNAGIFVFKVQTFIDEVKTHAPEFAKYFELATKSQKELKKIYKKVPKLPVDIALMEKTSKGAVISASIGWNDLGSWNALEEVLKESLVEAGLINAPAGSIAIGSKGNIVDVTSKKFVGLIGIHNLIVIETTTALLICAKEKAQDIKNLVEQIEMNKKLKATLL